MNLKDKILLLQQANNVYLNLNNDQIFYETDGEIKNVLAERGTIGERLNLRQVADKKLYLGVIGELYAHYIMSSLGYEVFPTIVDDHGIDLIAVKDNKKIKIQVKTVNVGTYVYFQKEKFDNVMGNEYIILYIRVGKEGKPTCYVYPSNIWKNIDENGNWKEKQFVFHPYSNKKSIPEYGIYGSQKYYDKPSEYCISTNDDWSFDNDKFENILKKYEA